MRQSHIDSIGWRWNWEGSGRLYRFWAGHRKVKHVAGIYEGPCGLDCFWFCDLIVGRCEGNLF